MSEPIETQIMLGGPIKRKDLPGLLAAIQKDGAYVDWGETDIVEDVQDLEERLLDPNLALTDHEANYGRMEAIEAFCKERLIAFDKHTGSKPEWEAETVYFRPPDTLVERQSDNNHYDVIRRDELIDVRGLLVDREHELAIVALIDLMGLDIPALDQITITN